MKNDELTIYIAAVVLYNIESCLPLTRLADMFIFSTSRSNFQEDIDQEDEGV